MLAPVNVQNRYAFETNGDSCPKSFKSSSIFANFLKEKKADLGSVPIYFQNVSILGFYWYFQSATQLTMHVHYKNGGRHNLYAENQTLLMDGNSDFYWQLKHALRYNHTVLP